MVTVYVSDTMMDLQVLQDALDPQWLAAWNACHKIGKKQAAACASLTGLYLLSRSGVRGTLLYEANGKPKLLDANVDFSIAHTGSYVFCALLLGSSVRNARIGLDAECTGRFSIAVMQELATRWFAKGEREAFAKAPTEDTFLRIWTRKEAYVKMTGEGMRALQSTDTVLIEREKKFLFWDDRKDGVVLSVCVPRDCADSYTLVCFEE
ncbi:MAG: 4'-phosphopantetheinyl transferase superfamily protein [Clostridia bacterium]|nr:4'-phosphopantetheinyl transferase superfamily protein [Clostridia bacterium]